MPVLIRTFLFLFALIFIGSMCANSADAQLVRGFNRHFGIYSGAGYHSRTPMTDSSYYNSYSPANSTYHSGVSGLNNYSSNGLYDDSSSSHPGTGAYGGSTSRTRNVSAPLFPVSKWHSRFRGNLGG